MASTVHTLTLAQLNAATPADVVTLLEGVYEHSPWIAEGAATARPFKSLAHLKYVLTQVVRQATPQQQIDLIRAHPELAGKAALAGHITAESTVEQNTSGLTHCTAAELAQLQQLNRDYNTRFGWPFVLAVRGPRGTGLSRTLIIETFARRLQHSPHDEQAECLRQIHRIAEIRLNDKFGIEPTLGNQILDWADALALHTEVSGGLTVTYLTPAHQACAAQLATWMNDCGFDEVTMDAVGNVIGVYHGTDRTAPRLLTGSHYDTVRNGGKYDGRLGIFAPMVCVREWHHQGKRWKHGLEVVAFAEEEGQRYKATFMGSSALVGDYNPDWLDLADADGVTVRQAMQLASLPASAQAILALKRDPAHYVAFVEIHIEQGPVLDDMDMPLGVVTAINGSLRYTGEIIGTASHAGTTPMDRRKDAAAAAAKLLLFVERRAGLDHDKPAGPSVGTVGVLNVAQGSINVVPGRCQFTLDLRAPNDAQRDALAQDVIAALQNICARRCVQYQLDMTLAAAAAPSDPTWQARWGNAVQALGLPVFALPSGAGHDAMKLSHLLPQAMLFVRGGHAGISHNPLEVVTNDDAQLAAAAFTQLFTHL